MLLLSVSSLAICQPAGIDLNTQVNEQLSGNQKPTGYPGPAVLEKPINPEFYVLGTGDVLKFRAWGRLEIQQVVTIGPDGYAAIPTVGEINAAGKTVNEVNSTLQSMISRIYPHSEVSLRLIKVRLMKVLISGAVREPGTYVISAVDRLSELIKLAQGFYEPEQVKDLPVMNRTVDKRRSSRSNFDYEEWLAGEPFPSKRNVSIMKLDGSERRVDYLRFIRTGDSNYNPILSDGDQVHVPIIDKEGGRISVFGSVKDPAEFEYIQGDCLADVIRICGGLTENALLSEIKIIRFESDHDSTREIAVDFIKTYGQKIELKADDRIFVREQTEFRLKHGVTVEGEVNFPGVYPIVQYKTTLEEIVKTCGGLTNQADLQRARVIRWSALEYEDPEYERLKKMSIADMNEMEYEYFKTRSREEAPAVVVDFKKLFVDNEKSQNIFLQDQDEIVIPVQLPTVNVTGNVNRPGLVSWIPGKTTDYYVEKTGGYSWNARISKMRLIRAQTGTWIKPKKNTPVEIGDTIFVPEKQELNYWQLWKDLMLVVSQIATVVIVVQTVR